MSGFLYVLTHFVHCREIEECREDSFIFEALQISREGTARYAGQLILVPAEGFGQGFFAFQATNGPQYLYILLSPTFVLGSMPVNITKKPKRTKNINKQERRKK